MRSGEGKKPWGILHIPHASRLIPPEIRGSLALADADLEAELIRMTDSFTDELFRCRPEVASRLVFPVSRLVVDPERFLDDRLEPMSRGGHGRCLYQDIRRQRASQESF